MLGFFIGIVLAVAVAAVGCLLVFKHWSKRLFGDLIVGALASVEADLASIRNASDLTANVKALRLEVEQLQTEKGRKQEEFDRREREVEHKLGLEKKRQELDFTNKKAEIDAAKRDAELTVREQTLAADRTRFEEQMKFHDDRFGQEVGYLKDMLGQMMERLPTAGFVADLTPAVRRSTRK